MMKNIFHSIYVAGKFEEKETVRAAQRQLEERDFTISHDWTQEDAVGLKDEVLGSYLAQCAENDYVGVRDADAVLLLNHQRAFGAMVEMGLAIGWGIPVFVVGHKIRDNIFFHLGSDYGIYCYDTVDEAIEAIEQMRQSIEELSDD